MDYTRNRMKSLQLHVMAIALLTVLAFWLRFANIDAINLYNDEYYQVETAAGLIETGEYKIYNFTTSELGEEYTRAKFFIQQVALSFKVFGYNEMAARLPAILWGTLLIPVMIVGLLLITKNPWLAYGTGLLILYDDFFIEMSRFTRMYTMLFVLSMIIMFVVYKLLSDISNKKRLGFGILAIMLSILSYYTFAELTLALWAGIGCYVTIRTLIFLIFKDEKDRICAWLFVAGALIALIVVIMHYIGFNLIPVDAFIIRSDPHFFYLNSVFSELHMPVFGLVMLLIGLFSIKSIKKFTGFGAVVAFFLLVYFIYFSHRWEAKRYIGFIVPLFYILIALGLTNSIKFILKLYKFNRISKIIICVSIFFTFGPWLSFPSIPTDYFIIQTAYADRSYDTINRAFVERAYDYVADHYQEGEVILVQGLRTFYWPYSDIPVYDLGSYKSLQFNDFIELTKESDSGVWMIYNENKSRHLDEKIRNYADNNFDYMYNLESTHVNVYHATYNSDVYKNVNE